MTMFMALALFISMLITALLLLFLVLQNGDTISLSEKTAFECGFSPKEAWSVSFSINYFFITLIFLIFDLEILLLAPMFLFNMTFSSTMSMGIIIMFFTALLTVEWVNGMLEWQE